MELSTEFAAYFAFIILPFLAVINAVAVGLFVGFALNFFTDTVLMRLLKVFLIPATFAAYLALFYFVYFDFDFWIEGVLAEETWKDLAFTEQFLTSVPVIAYILTKLVFYILKGSAHDLPREAEEENSSV